MKWILLCFACLVGCGSKDLPNQTLKISFNTHPTTTDPRLAADFVSSTLCCMIYEGLTRSLPDNRVELALAQSVEISKDQTLYTFHLRKAFWSDGIPITAHDFEKSWKKVLSPPKSCAFLFYPILGAEKCVRGEISIDEVGIRAVDDFTFEVRLERPTPYFYSLSAFPSFLPVPSHAPDDPSICSGPFQIEKLVHNSEINLIKNQAYWNKKAIQLDEIHISIVPDEMTALQMFEQGELDWLGASLSPLPLDALEKLKGHLEFIPTPATTLCTFNTESPPFSNLHFRKAFSYAIDRKEITEKIMHGSQHHASTFLPPTLSDQEFSLYDPSRAKLYLEKALGELGVSLNQLEPISLYYKSSQTEKRLAQTLQRQWKRTLGIEVELIQLDFKSHAQKLQTRDYQISFASWIAQFNDPVSILDRFRSKEHLKNYPGWENLKYIELLEKAAHSLDRKKLLNQAERLLVDEMPLTPIYHWSSPVIKSLDLKETPSSSCGGILFERFGTCKK